ncbi:MAG: hypothetical protein ACTHLO_11570 [Pseudolabrys sp.]
MSALGLDDVNDPRGVLAYAPRKPRRADDESTIRPVLERLSRSEGRVPGPRMVRKADVQDVPTQVDAVARSAFPMTARLAVAAGVLALVGAAAAGYLAPSVANHAAPSSTPANTATALPKPVQTVSIQRPADADAQPAARTVKDDARMPQPAAAGLSQASAAADTALPTPLQSTENDPTAAPLSAWAATPAQASGWSTPPAPSAQPAATVAQAAADTPAPAEAAPKPDAQEPAHKAAAAHHSRHVAHHRATHHRRQHTARAQASAQQSDQSAQPAETQPEPQPVKKLPLQAAIDRMFGNSAGTATAQPPQR